MLPTGTGGKTTRFAQDSGIAIGPILFIIAILGILATAIAAGSGSFSSSTTKESNSTRAAALIDIGQNLKIGFDRVLSYGGYDVIRIVIDPDETANEYDLFAPTGGGITPPSTNMRVSDSTVASTDVWYYPMLKIPSIGSVGARVAMLRIDAGVCDQVNKKANGIATTGTDGGTAGTVSAISDLATYQTTTGGDDTDTTNVVIDLSTKWPSAQSGQLTGCVNVTNAGTPTAGYYFYQVIGVK